MLSSKIAVYKLFYDGVAWSGTELFGADIWGLKVFCVILFFRLARPGAIKYQTCLSRLQNVLCGQEQTYIQNQCLKQE